MWQFTEAVRGLADGCQALGVPVTGGNVSFYNQTATAAIHPTPVIGVLGVHDDVRRAVGSGLGPPGSALLLLGSTRLELGGSLWARTVHGHLGGVPPAVDLAAERALAEVLVTAAERGLLAGAHDLSDGGLAVALAEACLASGTGAAVTLSGDPFTCLFSESAARALVAVTAGAEADLTRLCAAAGVPAVALGTAGGDSLDVAGCFSVSLGELSSAHLGTLPVLFS
jgi:phosphoribosylformylglycinamidine synthase